MKKLIQEIIEYIYDEKDYILSPARCKKLIKRYKDTGDRITKRRLIEYFMNNYEDSSDSISIESDSISIESDDTDKKNNPIENNISFIQKIIHKKCGLNVTESLIHRYIKYFGPTIDSSVANSFTFTVDDNDEYSVERRKKEKKNIIQQLIDTQSKELLKTLIGNTRSGEYLLYYEGEQTEDILQLLSNTEYCTGLAYVIDQTEELCLTVLKNSQSDWTFCSIRNPTEEMCNIGVKKNPFNLFHVPSKYQNEELICQVVFKNSLMLNELKKRNYQITERICLCAICGCPCDYNRCLKDIPEKFKTLKFFKDMSKYLYTQGRFVYEHNHKHKSDLIMEVIPKIYQEEIFKLLENLKEKTVDVVSSQ